MIERLSPSQSSPVLVSRSALKLAHVWLCGLYLSGASSRLLVHTAIKLRNEMMTAQTFQNLLTESQRMAWYPGL
ncbi:hypothetical protein CC2G_014697 [Coprinopsis cinerea AmutBmut pab1-1]|nr:hypothetical protein CC2G_014697 [Coprinopsis cinerea AmutBmut pab1-1]